VKVSHQNGEVEDEVLYTNPANNQRKGDVKLNTVVGLIDHVTDEMNFFKEKVTSLLIVCSLFVLFVVSLYCL